MSPYSYYEIFNEILREMVTNPDKGVRLHETLFGSRACREFSYSGGINIFFPVGEISGQSDSRKNTAMHRRHDRAPRLFRAIPLVYH